MKLIITDLEEINFKIQGEYKIIKPQGDIKHCIGCLGCFLKTPGECVINDGYKNMGSELGKCTEMIIISKCYYGSVSPFVKTVQDRTLPYVHPDFIIKRGEMHHRRRYDNIISFSAYFYGENITDEEKETAKNLIQANVDNYDGILNGVYFYNSIDEMREIIL